MWSESARIRLQEQPFQLLKMLVERPGEVVTREEIRGQLWPDGTVVEFDHSINAAIKKLRMALGESPEEPRYIETVARRGYRLIAKVDTPVLEHSAAGQEIDNSVEGLGRPFTEPLFRRRRSLLYAVSPVVIVLALGLLGWRGLYHQNFLLSTPRPPIRSLAVLPFENLSGDPSQSYFNEGITDELITNLAKLPNIRVISRTSVMQYAGTRKPLPQIAGELNVDGIVERSVTRDAQRVRIRVRLVHARRDEHMWAAAYERSLRNVLELQAEVASEIAGQLKLELSAQQRARLSPIHSVTPEAHELYLKGRHFWNKRDEPGPHKAIAYFEEAIAKDPKYAEAYSGLADSHILLFSYAATPPPMALERAKAAAEKAIQLDDRLAEGHTSLALIVTFWNWNWEQARRHYERALELNPNYATAHHWYGDGYLAQMGRLNDAMAEIRKALELDPLSPMISTDLGKNLIFARKYDEAIAQLKKTLELDPSFSMAHYYLWNAYMEGGKYSEAKLELENLKRYHEVRLHLADSVYFEAKLGNRKKAHQILAQLEKISRREYVNPALMAYAYVALGDKDQALTWLEKGYNEKLTFLGSLKIVPALDPLRPEPRFVTLTHRVGLPD